VQYQKFKERGSSQCLSLPMIIAHRSCLTATAGGFPPEEDTNITQFPDPETSSLSP